MAAGSDPESRTIGAMSVPPAAHANSLNIRAWRGGKVIETSDVEALGGLIGARGARTWIDLTDPEPGLVQRIAREIGLHPLVAEDIIESNERAKVILVGENIHIVTFVLARDGEIETLEVDFVLGKGFLLSVHPSAWDPMTAHQLKRGVGEILDRGPDFLLWALVDAIVDGYFPVFDALGDEIDEVQDAAIDRAVPTTLQHVFRLKRELIRIRHVVAPSREVFAQLTGREFELIAEPHTFYFRDVYDHLIRLNDELDAYRELVAGAIEVYLSTINNNLSAIMKRLTGVTVILAGIGAIAGVFGMSEAASALTGTEGSGFYLIALGTAALAAAALVVLRRIDWI
jgi:magnesium transporter